MFVCLFNVASFSYEAPKNPTDIQNKYFDSHQDHCFETTRKYNIDISLMELPTVVLKSLLSLDQCLYFTINVTVRLCRETSINL
jgi:hypothetical protein